MSAEPTPEWEPGVPLLPGRQSMHQGFVSAATCHECGRAFTEGESGWVEDVKVIEPGRVRLEQRYTCDDCEARR